MQSQRRSNQEHLAEIKRMRDEYEARISGLEKNLSQNLEVEKEKLDKKYQEGCKEQIEKAKLDARAKLEAAAKKLK